MQLNITDEVLVSQLGYSRNDKTMAQANKIIQNTKGFDKFAKHIISLNDTLKHINSFVAFSNSCDNLKIKYDDNSNSKTLEEFHNTAKHFSDKYNILLEKLPNKEVYYIIGKK